MSHILTLENLFTNKVTSEDFKGSTAYFRKMSVKNAAELQEKVGQAEQMVHIISSCLCDEEGTLLFDDEAKSELFHQDMETVSTLSEMAMRHSGLLANESDEVDTVKN